MDTLKFHLYRLRKSRSVVVLAVLLVVSAAVLLARGGSGTSGAPSSQSSTTQGGVSTPSSAVEVLSTTPIDVLDPNTNTGPLGKPPVVGDAPIVGNAPSPPGIPQQDVTLVVDAAQGAPVSSVEVLRMPAIEKADVERLAQLLGVKSPVEYSNGVYVAGGLNVSGAGDFNYSPETNTGESCQSFSAPCPTGAFQKADEKTALGVFEKAAAGIEHGSVSASVQPDGRTAEVKAGASGGRQLTMVVNGEGKILAFSGFLGRTESAGRYALVRPKEAAAAWKPRLVSPQKCQGACKVVSVSVTSMQLWSADGTSWLVPSYLLADEKGSTWQVPALSVDVLRTGVQAQ